MEGSNVLKVGDAVSWILMIAVSLVKLCGGHSTTGMERCGDDGSDPEEVVS
jgi:hypothetical protein